MYIRVPAGDGYNKIPRGQTPGLLGGLEVHPIRQVADPYYNYNANVFPVYECE